MAWTYNFHSKRQRMSDLPQEDTLVIFIILINRRVHMVLVDVLDGDIFLNDDSCKDLFG